jgi:hypothetical protein
VHGAMRKADVFCRTGGWVAVAAGLLLGMSACGSADNSAATHSGSTKSGPRHPIAPSTQPGEESLGEMVNAVSAAKVGPPVELKFSLPTRPEVGQVMDVDIAIVPRAPVPDSVSAIFQVNEGLEVVGGRELDAVDKLVDGTPVRHVVKVLPKRDGIFTLSAVVTFTSASQDSVRTFSIPVIAGQGLPEQVAKGP